MASEKLTNLPDLAANQVPDDLAYIVDVSAGVSGSFASTLNDLFSEITQNITDGTIRWGGFATPALSDAGEGALYFASASNTFKGSRNAGAYQNLLFGAGTNTQIAYWGSTTDTLLGSASWTFDNTLKTVTLSNADNLPNLVIQNTTAASPNEARLEVTRLQMIRFSGNGDGASLRIAGGRTGPLFPLSGALVGTIEMSGVNGGGVAPTTRGGIFIDAVATENMSLTNGGTGMRIRQVPNGTTGDVTRITITGSGQCIIGANGTQPTATLGGATTTKVCIGNLTTYNSNAAIQCGNPATGDNNITFLIQANPSQTQAVFRVEQDTGQTLFFIGQAGSITVASTATPAVSPTNQGRLYYDVPTQTLQLSTNGGAYGALLTGGSGGSGANSAISNLSSVSVNASLTPQTTLDLGATATPWRDLYLYGSGTFGSHSLRLTGTPTGNRVLTIPDVTDTFAVLGLAQTFTAAQTFATAARSSGSAAYLTVTAPADTGLTASTEAIGINFNGSATRQHATGAITTQREFVFQAPTYSFVAASTITNAATLAITGAPVAGTNATITNRYALWVQSDILRIEGSTSNSTLHVGPIEVQGFAVNNNWFGDNIFFNGGDFIRRAAGFTAQVYFFNGEYQARMSDTGSAGSIPTQILALKARYTGEAGLGGNISTTSGVFTGAAVYADTSGQVGIGKTSALTAKLHVVSDAPTRLATQIESANASTVALSNLIHTSDQTAAVRTHTQIHTRSSGTAATGLGGRLLFGLESSTTNDQDAVAADWVWTAATHATRTADFVLNQVYQGAALAETFRVTARGYAIDQGIKRVSTQFDKTSDTTLANITGLSVNVAAGRTYTFEGILFTTSGSSGGVQAAIAGTATATTIVYEALTFNGAAISAQTRATALGTTVGGVTAVTASLIRITGTITVNAAGTLTVQFAQNASNATTSSVLVGSSFIVRDNP